jgi:hypothetical protein
VAATTGADNSPGGTATPDLLSEEEAEEVPEAEEGAAEEAEAADLDLTTKWEETNGEMISSRRTPRPEWMLLLITTGARMKVAFE